MLFFRSTDRGLPSFNLINSLVSYKIVILIKIQSSNWNFTMQNYVMDNQTFLISSSINSTASFISKIAISSDCNGKNENISGNHILYVPLS